MPILKASVEDITEAIKIIKQQTCIDDDTVISKALEKNNMDVATTIMDLMEYEAAPPHHPKPPPSEFDTFREIMTNKEAVYFDLFKQIKAASAAAHAQPANTAKPAKKGRKSKKSKATEMIEEVPEEIIKVSEEVCVEEPAEAVDSLESPFVDAKLDQDEEVATAMPVVEEPTAAETPSQTFHAWRKPRAKAT